MTEVQRRRLRTACVIGVPLLLVVGLAAAATMGDDDGDGVPVAAQGATSSSTPAASTVASTASTTPAPATTVRPGGSTAPAPARVQVKFAEGSGVRLRNGALVSLSGTDIGPLSRVLSRYPGTGIDRLFQRPEADLAAEKAAVEARTGKPQPDLNLWYVLALADGSKVDALIADLKQLAVVEQANRDPVAAPPPAPAP